MSDVAHNVLQSGLHLRGRLVGTREVGLREETDKNKKKGSNKYRGECKQ